MAYIVGNQSKAPGQKPPDNNPPRTNAPRQSNPKQISPLTINTLDKCPPLQNASHAKMGGFDFDVVCLCMQNSEEIIAKYAVDANLFQLGSTNPKKNLAPG